MNAAFLAQPLPPANPPLLGTTGTELLQFGLLIAVGVGFARREGRPAGRFVASSLAAVSLFYWLCPETSAFQRSMGEALMSGMAVLQAGVMRLFGAPVHAEGPCVVGSFRFTYAQGCMGLSYLAMAMLVLLVQPTTWRRRLAGLPSLAAGMIGLNLVRLVVLYQLWSSGNTGAYLAFHRIGGGLFAVGAVALYAGILAFRLRPAATPCVRPVPA